MATTRAFELETDLRNTVDGDRKWPLDYNAGKANLLSFGQFNTSSDIDVNMDRSFLEELMF